MLRQLLLLSPIFSVVAFHVSSIPSHRRSLALLGTRLAQELVTSLVQEEQCYSTVDGAIAFGEACAFNVVYEDCFEAQPVAGKTVSIQLYYMSLLCQVYVAGSLVRADVFVRSLCHMSARDESHVGQGCKSPRQRSCSHGQN
jgi:hypothetical protein